MTSDLLPTERRRRRGLRRLTRAEALRVVLAALVTAGAVLLIQALTGGHSQAPRAAESSGPGDAATGASSNHAHLRPSSVSRSGAVSASKAPASSGGPPLATVANGPAVVRSLRAGWMTVVIDQPPPGLFSEQNRSVADGAAIAVQELNAAGGLPNHIHIRLVPETLDGLSATAVRRRLDSESAAALVLPCDTDSQASLTSAAASFGMLMLAPCNPNPTLARTVPTYWPIGVSAGEEMAELANFINTLGYSNVMIVTSAGSRYVELLSGDFRSAVQAKGIRLAGSVSVSLGLQDVSNVVHAIESAHPTPGAIFTALPPPLVNHLAASLAAQGLHQTVLGTSVMDSRATLQSDSGALENATFPSLGFARQTSAARRFATDYRNRFRAAPVGSFAGIGFEAIRLVEDAVRKARSAQPRAIQRALIAGIALNGVGLADRLYRGKGDHEPVGEVAIEKVSGTSFEPLFAGMPSHSLGAAR